MSPNNIAIIGGGPAGLTLARILHINNISCTVFEGEESALVRLQGGSLDLHPRSGQAALKAAELFDQFEKYARVEGEDLCIKDKNNKSHVQILETARDRPEIDRTQLRQILLDSLPEGMVQWGYRVKSVEIGTLHFYNKPSASGFDLIVGGDGAWSKVRPLLTTIPPFYSGISGIEIWHKDVETKHPEIAAMVGKGSHFVFGEEERRALLSQRQGDGSLRTYAFLHAPEAYLKSEHLDLNDPESIRRELLKEYKNFSPELRRLITDFDPASGDSLTSRALYMLPVGVHWPTLLGVTLIGDAAHLMTPFAGEGVNMAMQDAMELAHAIVKSPVDLTAAVKEYEQAMFPRATAVMQKTWVSLLSRFAPGGIAEFKARVRKGLEQALKAGQKVNVTVSED